MYWLLRVACAAEFIGHGAFGIITKAAWVPYFAFVGHGAYGAVLAKPAWFGYFAVLGVPETAVQSAALMTLVGGGEIALGLLVLAAPAPALLVFMATWKAFSEFLRVPAGEPFWE